MQSGIPLGTNRNILYVIHQITNAAIFMDMIRFTFRTLHYSDSCFWLAIALPENHTSIQQRPFFITMPMMMLSGALAPVESMPPFFAYLSLLNPLRHYITIVRAILLRGVGLEVIFPNAIALLIFAIVLITLSANRFRQQVS